MIDNGSILLSVCAVGYVLMRAFVLNKTLPWFGKGIEVQRFKRRNR